MKKWIWIKKMDSRNRDSKISLYSKNKRNYDAMILIIKNIIIKHYSDDLFRLLKSYNCLKNNGYRYLSVNYFISFS